MGARASLAQCVQGCIRIRGAGGDDLDDQQQPLLPPPPAAAAARWGSETSFEAQGSDGRMLCRVSSGASTCESVMSSAPLSFKSKRSRKTKDFIGSVKSNSARVSWVAPTDVDPRLLEDADAHIVSSKVAAMIIHRWEQSGSLAMGQGGTKDQFHEFHFTKQSGWPCHCWPQRRKPIPRVSQDAVFSLINELSTSLYFCQQVVVLSAVYIERLLDHASVVITDHNWRSLVVVTLLVASKVWEDIHPWNADFESCLHEVCGIDFRSGALYQLESLFLDRLRWNVFVDGEIYASFYFSLASDSSADPPGVYRRPTRSRTTDSFAFDTIIEDEVYVNSDSDIERGIYPEGASLCSETVPCSSASASSPTPPRSPTPTLPWSREDMLASWRKRVLDNGGAGILGETFCGVALRAKRDAWKLDAGNPHIGALRHAPRALAPSLHLPQSAELLWAHELASRSADVFGPPVTSHLDNVPEATVAEEDDAAKTISGVTGCQLASELRLYLHRGSGPSPKAVKATPDQGLDKVVSYRPSLNEVLGALEGKSH